MIAAGMGAGIGPRTSRRLQLDGVVFRDLYGVPDDLHMELAMAWRTNAASRVTTAFRETAIEVACDLYPTMDEDRPLFKDSVGWARGARSPGLPAKQLKGAVAGKFHIHTFGEFLLPAGGRHQGLGDADAGHVAEEILEHGRIEGDRDAHILRPAAILEPLAEPVDPVVRSATIRTRRWTVYRVRGGNL